MTIKLDDVDLETLERLSERLDSNTGAPAICDMVLGDPEASRNPAVYARLLSRHQALLRGSNEVPARRTRRWIRHPVLLAAAVVAILVLVIWDKPFAAPASASPTTSRPVSFRDYSREGLVNFALDGLNCPSDRMAVYFEVCREQRVTEAIPIALRNLAAAKDLPGMFTPAEITNARALIRSFDDNQIMRAVERASHIRFAPFNVADFRRL